MNVCLYFQGALRNTTLYRNDTNCTSRALFCADTVAVHQALLQPALKEERENNQTNTLHDLQKPKILFVSNVPPFVMP